MSFMKYLNKEIRYIFLLPLLVIATMAWVVIKQTPGHKFETEFAPGFVVLELFTSQGCSSCPPADALLAEYANGKNKQIIPLSFHVDYWNRLGWVDPFSNKLYSERQQWYSQHLPKGSIYTPQLIVNGQAEVVGNNRTAVKGLVEKQLNRKQQASIEVSTTITDKHSLNCNYVLDGSWENSLINFALVEKKATTHIQAGENEGKIMTNQNIVRQFISKPAIAKGSQVISLPENMPYSAYSIVMYLQNMKTGEIKAATQSIL
jgi:hypothetical protein